MSWFENLTGIAEDAKLILDAAYEATLCAALVSCNDRVFLTSLGGGAFGNRDEWTAAAILKALKKYRDYDLDYDLDVAIVSYGSSKPRTARLVQQWQAEL